MAKITINGVDVPLPVLPFGVVKANKATIDAVSGPATDLYDRAEKNVAFLKLSAPDADFEAASPAPIKVASEDLFSATFARPEEPAQA